MKACKRRITVLEDEQRRQEENYNALFGENGRLEDALIDHQGQRVHDQEARAFYEMERAVYRRCHECPVCFRQYNMGQAKPYMLGK
ncbi:hypothetical protein B9Z55_025590 [Caenorhabditis nigoni]|uniref:Uncharacterized protein n=1 Tax=Caenorhabditis nigoni TaxID=1611254 RepID=A0A2G5SZI9_9PELO|nr:hypothetical protein B9Z55_025590 [Caenorhabditis nigoni]